MGIGVVMNFRQFLENDLLISRLLSSEVQNPEGLKIGERVLLSDPKMSLRLSNYRGEGTGDEVGVLLKLRMSDDSDIVGRGHLVGYVKFSKIGYWVPLSLLRRSGVGSSVLSFTKRIARGFSGVMNPKKIGIGDIVYIKLGDLRNIFGNYVNKESSNPARVFDIEDRGGILRAKIKFSGSSRVWDNRGIGDFLWVDMKYLNRLIASKNGELYHAS